MFRPVFFVLLFIPFAGFAQDPAQTPARQAPVAAPDATTAPQPLSEEVADAEAAIGKSDWKAAQAKLEPWLINHPKDARALFDAGYAADYQNRLDDAASLYRRATEANPNSFEAHLSLGLLLARQGNLNGARPELVTAANMDAGDSGHVAKARAWRALAEIDRKTDPAQASNDLIQALKLSPETTEDTLLAASLADQAGQTEAAEGAYRRVLAQDPKSVAANAGLAHLLIARKQYSDAETTIRAALEQAPGDPALTAQLATVLVAQDKAEALPTLQKLHDAHPADANITRMMAEVLAEAGDAVGSDKLYTGLMAASPNNLDLLVAHGQNLIRQLKYNDAFGVFKQATELDPANADAWSGLAFAASNTNRPSITLHALTMRSKLLPENPSTYFLWATSYDMLHQRKSAATCYHQFLKSSAGKFPDLEIQARQRLLVLESKN